MTLLSLTRVGWVLLSFEAATLLYYFATLVYTQAVTDETLHGPDYRIEVLILVLHFGSAITLAKLIAVDRE
jgi:hypothetical protein